MNNRSVITLMFFAAVMSDAANAVPILANAVAIQPVSVVATSTLSGFPADRTINQVGLSPKYISGVTPASAIDSIVADPLQGWYGQSTDLSGNITFDLGGSYTLDRVFLFWTGGGTNNNIANFNIDVSADASFTSFVTAATFGFPTAAKDRVDFPSRFTGEFVRLDWKARQGDYPGLKQFVAGGVPSSVPEPASIALLGIGLAGIGAMRRKHKA